MKLTPTARGIAALFSTSFILAFGHGMTFPTIPVLADEFDISIAFAAQIVTAYAIGRFAGTLPAGALVDHFGVRITMLLGPVLITAAALSVVVTPFFTIVLVALFVAGIGDSMWQIGREIAGIQMVRSDQRGRLMSGFMGFNSAGMAIGPVLGGVLAQLVDYRAAYLVYAGLALIILAVALGTKSLPMERQHHQGQPATEGAGPVSLWRRPLDWTRNIPALVREIEPRFRTTYLVFIFATFVMMLYRFAWQALLPVFADAELGLTPTEIGLLFFIMGIVVFAMIVPAGFVVDKIGRKWATVPSTGIPAIAFLTIPFADSFLHLAGIMVLMGLANGLSLGSVATSTYDVIPSNSRGRLQALRRTVSEIGGIGGPALGGVIVSVSSPGVPFLVYAPLLVIASLLLGFVAKETLIKKPKQVFEHGPG